MSGVLYVVATPIGNLGDLSPRAFDVLTSAATVYCEDTRRTRTLFAAKGFPTPHLVALHEHNEESLCATVVQRVLGGETLALVSDAGTPGISDPGQRVIHAVTASGGTVSPIPGPAAVIAALVVSGLNTDRFVMEGFLPRKTSERAVWLDHWDSESRTIVFYESPQRIGATLTELAARWPERQVAVARELTKIHEEVLRGSLSEIAAQLSTRDVVGECVVVLDGRSEVRQVDRDAIRERLAHLLAQGESVRDAAAQVSSESGVSHREAYDIALEIRAANKA